jgi:hypothetical protein
MTYLVTKSEINDDANSIVISRSVSMHPSSEGNAKAPAASETAVTDSASATGPALDLEGLHAVSQRAHALIPLICFPIGILLLATCIASIAWLTFHGPALVPLQDTRVTTIIISSGTRLSMIVMMAAFARSAWASAVPTVLAGKQF